MRSPGSPAPLPTAACALLIAWMALPARGQNLLPNGSFDHDLAGWTTFAAVLAPTWSSLDAHGAPSSGSLRVVNGSPNDNFAHPAATHCVPVVAGERYRARGSFFYPAGQSHPGTRGGVPLLH